MREPYCPDCGEDEQHQPVVVAGTWICRVCFEVHPVREEAVEVAAA